MIGNRGKGGSERRNKEGNSRHRKGRKEKGKDVEGRNGRLGGIVEGDGGVEV